MMFRVDAFQKANIFHPDRTSQSWHKTKEEARKSAKECRSRKLYNKVTINEVVNMEEVGR